MNKTQSKISTNLKFVYSDNSLSIVFPNNELLMGILGEFNKNLKELENLTNSNLYFRGNSIITKGDDKKIQIIKNAIQFLCDQYIINGSIEKKDIISSVSKFMINETYGVVLKYPSFKDLELLEGTTDVEKNLNFLAANLKMVYDEKTVYDNFSQKEAYDFILSLTTSQLDKINDFFSNLPVMKHTIEYKCAGCGETVKEELRGLSDFFSLG